MTIKNIKSEFSTDQYADSEIFDIAISQEVVEAIKTRRHLLARLKESLPESNDQLCFFPSEGIVSKLGTAIAIHIAATAFENDDREGFMVEFSDSDDYTYESEWLPYEALDKQRFLLMFGDDREVYEFNQDEGDDIEDFTAIYADSREEATNQLLELVADSRECFDEQEDADHIREMKS